MTDYRELLNDVSDADAAFGTTKFLPAYDELPEEFKQHNWTKWNRLFYKWFYSGLSDDEVVIIPKEGVDLDLAIKFLGAHMASWATKHEHKEAGVAFMMSQLFDDVKFLADAA